MSGSVSLWWVDPRLWVNGNKDDHGYIDSVERPYEYRAINHVRKQAEREREPLLKMLIQLERWYIFHQHNLSTFKRISEIATRVGMTYYQVADALEEGYEKYGEEL